MKKYLFIYKSEVMSELQYVFNILVSFISFFILILIFLNLWQYIYSDPNELINGYDMKQMIWYVIITEILWMSLSGRKLCRRISEDVKGGNIAYNLNKPYNYIGYILSSHLGAVTVTGIMLIILGILLGFIFLHSFPSLNILSIIVIFLSEILATIISSLLIISIGLLSFYIEDSAPLYWVYSKIILVIGTLFPIEYFPVMFQPIIKLSPIYVVSYGPAKLFVDFSWNSVGKILTTQIVYIFISYAICYLIYRNGVRKLNVNGG